MACGATRTIFVKIAREGGKITEYALPYGILVRELCVKAGLTATLEECMFVNGSRNNPNYILQDKDIVIIKRVPNQVTNITVRVGKVGSILRSVVVRLDSKVMDVLSSVGIFCGPDEDIWSHNDGTPQGVLTRVSDIAYNGQILVIEKKKKPLTLKEKINDILEEIPDDEDFVDALITMLRRDYLIA